MIIFVITSFISLTSGNRNPVFQHADQLNLDGNTCALPEGGRAGLPMRDSAYTLFMEVKPSADSDKLAGLVSWGNTDGNESNEFRFCGSNCLTNYGWTDIWRGNNYIRAEVTNTNFFDGVWRAVATTYDGNAHKIYVNGVLVATKTGEPAVRALYPENTFCVGRSGHDYNTHRLLGLSGSELSYHKKSMKGSMRNIRIYNVALSALELANIATRVPTPTTPAPATGGSMLSDNCNTFLTHVLAGTFQWEQLSIFCTDAEMQLLNSIRNLGGGNSNIGTGVGVNHGTAISVDTGVGVNYGSVVNNYVQIHGRPATCDDVANACLGRCTGMVSHALLPSCWHGCTDLIGTTVTNKAKYCVMNQNDRYTACLSECAGFYSGGETRSACNDGCGFWAIPVDSTRRLEMGYLSDSERKALTDFMNNL